MNDNAFVEPEKIMVIVLSLVLLSVGALAVGIIVNTQNNTGAGNHYTETFTVTNPDEDQYLHTGEKLLSNIIVKEYDGSTWSTISESYWTYNSDTGVIIVDSDGL